MTSSSPKGVNKPQSDDVLGVDYDFVSILMTRSFKLAGARCGARFSDHLAGRRSRDLDISEALANDLGVDRNARTKSSTK